MIAREFTILRGNWRVRVTLDKDSPTDVLDRQERLLRVFAECDHDNGQPFARRFPAACYAPSGERIGTAELI